MARLLLIFLLAGLAGWAGSRRVPAPSGEDRDSSAPGEIRSSAKPRLRTPDDFKSWAASRAPRLEAHVNWYTSYQAELGAWSPQDIRAALDQGIHDPAVILSMSPESKALHALLSEWTRRDPDAAWAWLESLPSATMRWQLAGSIAAGWPAERAEEALELVLAHRDSFENSKGYSHSPIVQKAFDAAAARGPAACDAMLARLRAQGLTASFGTDFPAGFDFAALVRLPTAAEELAEGRATHILDAWMARDPQAALDYMVSMNREQGAEITRNLFSGFNRTQGGAERTERAARLGAAIARLPELEQHQIVEAATTELWAGPGNLKAFIGAIPDAALRGRAQLAAARELITKDPPAALEYLEAGTDPANRLELLQEMLAARPKEATAYNPFYRQREQAVRKTLAAWNTPPERADAFVKLLWNSR
ncbi:hypothetical protein [Luteolibacter sp. Populi]|uniref:hypothetical protein n=1 Tax=Luteolibacter sp. Populi TaxID=3230487 RepID=UPI003467B296